MKLAKGDRVLDDPKLLRRSLKKEKKAKAKKAEAWQARNEATVERQRAAQDKCAHTASTATLTCDFAAGVHVWSSTIAQQLAGHNDCNALFTFIFGAGERRTCRNGQTTRRQARWRSARRS